MLNSIYQFEREADVFKIKADDGTNNLCGANVRRIRLSKTPRLSQDVYKRQALPAMLNTFMPALMSMEMRVLFWQRNSAAEALYTARNG